MSEYAQESVEGGDPRTNDMEMARWVFRVAARLARLEERVDELERYIEELEKVS